MKTERKEIVLVQETPKDYREEAAGKKNIGDANVLVNGNEGCCGHENPRDIHEGGLPKIEKDQDQHSDE